MNSIRFKKIQTGLKRPLLIKKKENLFYLTGRSLNLTAEEYLLLTKNQAIGFGGGLEKITWVKKVDRLKNIDKYLKGKHLDLEWGFTYGEGEYIKSKVKSKKLIVTPTRSLVDVVRQVKDTEELLKIKKSMQIVERVFKLVRGEILKSGMTEVRLARYCSI